MPCLRLAAAVCLVATVAAPTLHAQSLGAPAARAGQEMAAAAGAPVSLTPAAGGTVGFLRTTVGAPIPAGRPGQGAEARARAFLQGHGRAFGLVPGMEMETLRVHPADRLGRERVRLRQTWRGVPVAGGELSVHLDGDGVGGAELSTPRLEILDRALLGAPGPGGPRLAWFVEARKVDLREYVWIDAHDGGVLLSFSQLAHGRNRLTYDANDPGDLNFDDLPGTLVRSEATGPAAGANAADVNGAHDHAGDTYDYFFSTHGRDSYDDAGAPLLSTVRFCPSSGECPYGNAFWNGVQMVYGTGYAGADDVVAHELTHAVTEHSANLFYYMQSGALNESYSDIFGETVDLLNGTGADGFLDRWEIGEDLPIGSIRDMWDPTSKNDPAIVGGAFFYCSGGDAGGVHINSGVPNRAYALMVDGGAFNGQNVTGIGLDKAARVQYRALTEYLLSASDFLDNDQALRQSCQDLVGTDGITAADCTEVGKALDAVAMAAPWPCSPAQAEVPALCPSGSPSLWALEDFESGLPGFPACPTNSFPTDWCLNGPESALGAFATSGEKSLWGFDQATTDLIAAEILFGGMPPAGARLQFAHSYGFETYFGKDYDGGQVQVTTDGGATWTDAGSLIVAGQPYTGIIQGGQNTNPLAGQSGFIKDSFGYTASQLDLANLGAGSELGIRFLVGTDVAGNDYGWFVDDVQVYTCVGGQCVANLVLDVQYNGGSTLYQASDSITAGNGYTVAAGETVTMDAGNRVVLTDGFAVAGGLVVKTGAGCQ
jgi:Zn-dependent metalloprotease